ncbi:hypothetical protein BJ980_002450 [Nocardioides daedukensis]|uniref:Tissue inhibitor of metalloproteinase n=1 Tax=Nocardioides daedukensis TaxID=634462 RepID=A0A7Y9RZI5_9ACTN|nr:hypothetical protein [Nocardioides daedukensis]NYG59527.1 hypothetical protein [Nocardioides daedukensis]
MRRVFRLLFAPVAGPLLGLILGGASLVVLSAPAHACSCASVDTAEQVEGADQVLLGTADARAEAGNRVELVVTVDEVLKGDPGDVGDKVSVITHRDSASCGLEPLPEPGVPWVFFAYGEESVKGLATNLCSGSAPADEADLELIRSTAGSPADTQSDDSPKASPNGEAAEEGDTGSADGEIVPLWLLLTGLLVVAAAAGAVAVRRTR